jgi:YesN/AraC family two-component response regulator
MYQDAKDRKPGYERIIISAINIVLLKCAQWFALHNNSKNAGHYVTGYYGSLQLVENYRRLIHEHFRREHFVKFYADKLNLTPNYLNMVVKNITGFNASDLIRQQIILEAKHLLIHTQFSHKEVAHELGFSDQSYFTRFFKRETGQRPLDWFRKNR